MSKFACLVLLTVTVLLYLQTENFKDNDRQSYEALEAMGYPQTHYGESNNGSVDLRRDSNKDETIDKYENKAGTENFQTTGEITHIAFLKVHKAASSTVQNILMRFGLKRNLSFVIPTPAHYISKHKTYFSDLWPPLPKEENTQQGDVQNDTGSRESNKYDILCNHMVFNTKKVSRLLHTDSFYTAIVREPLDQFLSAAYYYKFKWKYPYLVKLSNKTYITDLIRNPLQYEATSMSESMTYNAMAYDFGLKFETIQQARTMSKTKFDEFLQKTNNTFHLVMLSERFDKSLVLLKRYLNWNLEDILYVRSNSYLSHVTTNTSKMFKLTAHDTLLFRRRNKFDYGIYDLFKDRLEKQIAKEDFFEDEVNHFKKILRDVKEFCLEEMAERVHPTSYLPSDWGKTFGNVTHNNISKQNEISKGERREQTEELLNIINPTIADKEMTDNQESDLHELAYVHSKTLNEWQVSAVTTFIPWLFYDKPEVKGDELLIAKSKWNKEFVVTSSDCELIAMDELSIFREVKMKHLKLLIRRKFGDNFSVIEAVNYVLSFY